MKMIPSVLMGASTVINRLESKAHTPAQLATVMDTADYAPQIFDR